jgi:glutamyl-tRNA synthetase
MTQGTTISPASSKCVVGRLAPSPTGAQHIGNARTYLIAWLSAHSQGGRVVLRIEDIDSPRVKIGADAEACEDLRWLGLDWDEGPVIQSDRLECYRDALERLQALEKVYPCTCTRSDIERAASAPHEEHEGPIYPATCAGRRAADAHLLGKRDFAWRFRSEPGPWRFEDRYLGCSKVGATTLGGDFVVWKSAGTPAYQLAVVVDDAANGVTEVVRGDDLVPSTPRQLQIYKALDLAPPSFAHVPLVVGPDGRRLAKRHGDTRLSSLRHAGVNAESLLGLLAWTCGWLEEIAPVKLADLLPRFRFDTIPPGPFVLTSDHLASLGYRGV